MGLLDYATPCVHDLKDCEKRLSSEYTKQSNAMQSALMERLDRFESHMKKRFDEIEARLGHIKTELDGMEHQLRARK